MGRVRVCRLGPRRLEAEAESAWIKEYRRMLDERMDRLGDFLVLSALAPAPGEEFRVLDALRRLGARAVTREGERVVAWLPPPADVAAQLREAEMALRRATGLADPALLWRWQSRAAWAEEWVRALAPRRVTDRIVVAPTGRQVDHEAGDVVIRLEPGMSFGTAEHATTRGCLRLLEAVVRKGDHVADIGTGSGILAIAAALLGAGQVLALEADPLACADARRNVAVNDVAGCVSVREQVVRPADLRALPRMDAILANLEAGLVRSLLPALHAALVPQGTLIVSGVSGDERLAVLAAAATAGFELDLQDTVDGWWCAALRAA